MPFVMSPSPPPQRPPTAVTGLKSNDDASWKQPKAKVAEDKVITAARQLIREGLQPKRGSGWLSHAELPTNDEVVLEALQRPLPNHTDTTYLDKESYLEVQYKLLRFEGIEPLLRAVRKFKADPLMAEDLETCIYDKVHCVSMNIIRLGPLARLRFCNLRSDRLIDWGQTQRLTPGSCVALSTLQDNFRTKCWVAFVAGKDDKNLDDIDTPVIDVELQDYRQLADFVDPLQEFVMVEARSNYYEAVRHVMMGLKQAATEDSLLMGYFTGKNRHVGLPKSVSGPDARLDISAVAANPSGPLHMPVQGDVPELLQGATGLDGSQLSALQRMLAADLAVVQGPPGTGKTHTSMAALRVLLAAQGPGDAPIIVTAQKNDTVDELLTRLLSSGIKCARLGGQTKNDEVDRCTVVKLREQFDSRSTQGQELERLLNFQRAKVKVLINRALPSKREMFLDPAHLAEYGILSAAQCSSLTRRKGDCGVKGDSRGPEQHVFARWLGQRFSQRGEPQAFQLPRVDSEGAAQGALYRSQVYLAETDNSHKRKDTISSQVINFGSWCEVAVETLSAEQRAAAGLALKKHDDLFDVPEAVRPIVYRALEEAMLAASQHALREVFGGIATLVHNLKAERWVEDFTAIRKSGARVIGCTTTGLTKYRALLGAFGPKIIMVEEAAESREANISAALLPSVEQLILIGDHLQLSPHADVMELSREPYNLHISAFERFILRGIGYTTLSDQRRMATEMRKVLNRWYPSLRDHTDVSGLPYVPGMGRTRALWIDHRQPENGNRYSSKFNSFEARLITGFARYLVASGVDPSRITVLSFYSGQKIYVYNIMQKVPELRTVVDAEEGFVVRQGVESQTVDGYQGKENDIILLSVVRSPGVSGDGGSGPTEPSVGFLDRLNRAIVALSRGKLLNVVFGNMTNLLRSPSARDIWKPVSASMQMVKASAIPLVCAGHGRVMAVTAAPEVWDKPSRIGCGAKCDHRLECGHVCISPCHPPATDHLCGCGAVMAKQSGGDGLESGPLSGHSQRSRTIGGGRRDLLAHMEYLTTCASDGDGDE